MDYNATTPISIEVADVINHAVNNYWANPSGIYEKSKESKAKINEARKNLATMLNTKFSSDIIFSSGGTEVS